MHISFVLGRLIFKHHGRAIEPKHCYWMIASLYRRHNAFSNREVAHICINPNKNIEQ